MKEEIIMPYRKETIYKVICLDDRDQYVWASRSKSWTDRAEAQHYADTCVPSRKALVLIVEGF